VKRIAFSHVPNLLQVYRKASWEQPEWGPENRPREKGVGHFTVSHRYLRKIFEGTTTGQLH